MSEKNLCFAFGTSVEWMSADMADFWLSDSLSTADNLVSVAVNERWAAGLLLVKAHRGKEYSATEVLSLWVRNPVIFHPGSGL